jgi:hypothetical protein
MQRTIEKGFAQCALQMSWLLMLTDSNVPGFVHVMDKPSGLQNCFELLFARKAE